MSYVYSNVEKVKPSSYLNKLVVKDSKHVVIADWKMKLIFISS